MGYLEPEEVTTYRKLYTLLGVGGGVFLLGFLILVFGRTYAHDGSNYDLYMVFGLIFVIVGLGIAAYPLAMQVKLLCKGLNRKDDLQPGFGYMAAPSAAGQVMRNTQIFSSAPPSTYDGGLHQQQQQVLAQQHQQQQQYQQQQQQQQAALHQFQQRGASYNPQGAHQFSSAAAAMYRAGSGDQLAIKPAHSQTSLSRQNAPLPPSYQESYQPPSTQPMGGRAGSKPQVSHSSEI